MLVRKFIELGTDHNTCLEYHHHLQKSRCPLFAVNSYSYPISLVTTDLPCVSVSVFSQVFIYVKIYNTYSFALGFFHKQNLLKFNYVVAFIGSTLLITPESYSIVCLYIHQLMTIWIISSLGL